MRPHLFDWGFFHLSGYGLMVVIGGVFVFGLLYPRKKELGLKTDEQYWMFVNMILVSGPLSARLMYVFEYTKPFSQDFWRALVASSSGYSSFGSFIGMPLAYYAFARWYKIHFMRFFDGICLMACAWHGFGRVGCFLAGCCHGTPTNWPWGIVFTDPASQIPPQWLGVPLHPTQLIEAVGDGVITFFLYRAFKREGGSGLVVATWFLLYGPLRFFTEFLRGDTVPLSFGLTAGQVFSLGLIAAGGALLVWRSRHNYNRVAKARP